MAGFPILTVYDIPRVSWDIKEAYLRIANPIFGVLQITNNQITELAYEVTSSGVSKAKPKKIKCDKGNIKKNPSGITRFSIDSKFFNLAMLQGISTDYLVETAFFSFTCSSDQPQLFTNNKKHKHKEKHKNIVSQQFNFPIVLIIFPVFDQAVNSIFLSFYLDINSVQTLNFILNKIFGANAAALINSGEVTLKITDISLIKTNPSLSDFINPLTLLPPLTPLTPITNNQIKPQQPVPTIALSQSSNTGNNTGTVNPNVNGSISMQVNGGDNNEGFTIQLGYIIFYYTNNAIHAQVASLHPAVTVLSFQVTNNKTSGIITIKQNVGMQFTTNAIIFASPVACPSSTTTGISSSISVLVNQTNTITFNQISVSSVPADNVTIDVGSATFTSQLFGPFTMVSEFNIQTQP